MSDYVNNHSQNALLEEKLTNDEWTQLLEQIMSLEGLQSDDADWSALDQGVEDQALVPDEGPALDMDPFTPETAVGSQAVLSPSQASPAPGLLPLVAGRFEPSELAEPFICGFQGCKSQPFKRRGDLNRHRRTHGPQGRLDCPVQDCNRRGVRGFSRKDKLNDHMLAGHGDDDIFICLHPRCGLHFTRDLFSVHMMYRDPYRYLNGYRTCPLPRCSFKVLDTKLDNLQSHLQNTHDLKGRAKYANVLLGRGYDFESCKIVCPACLEGTQFTGHGEFAKHFMGSHFNGPICGWHNPCSDENCEGRHIQHRLSSATIIPDEVHQHRRTILSLFPEFKRSPGFQSMVCRS